MCDMKNDLQLLTGSNDDRLEDLFLKLIQETNCKSDILCYSSLCSDKGLINKIKEVEKCVDKQQESTTAMQVSDIRYSFEDWFANR